MTHKVDITGKKIYYQLNIFFANYPDDHRKLPFSYKQFNFCPNLGVIKGTFRQMFLC